MATYYVSNFGSDANNGTSPQTPWLTLTKSLGAAGISSGDTLYLAGGSTFREVITINMVSATVETSIIGDVDGSKTGLSGEVKVSPFLINDETLPSSSTTLNLNGRDFLTFRNITFIGPNNAVCIQASTATSTNINFLDCTFLYSNFTANTISINITVGFGVNSSWVINRCLFLNLCSLATIQVTLTTGTGSDYDANVKILNSLFICNLGVSVVSGGTSNQEGGGVIVQNCSFFDGTSAISVGSTRIGGTTFTFPCYIQNCLIFNRNNGTAISSSELGNLIENYNIIVGNSIRSNVLIGAQTVSDGSVFTNVNIGQELKYGGRLRPFLSPARGSSLASHADRTIAPIDDMLGGPRPMGDVFPVTKGIATSAASNGILTDTSNNFGINSLAGLTLRIQDGLGKGQCKTIAGNTSTVISGDGQWITTPDSTSQYLVYQGPTSLTSIVTSATTTTLTDSYARWGVNFFQGYTCSIDSGQGAGGSFVVSGNSPTTLTGFGPFVGNGSVVVTGNAYSLYWGSGSSASGIDYIHTTVGCYNCQDTALQETGIFLSGNSSVKLVGPSYQDFRIPVTGASTVISVWGYYDQFYSGTLKPQLTIWGGEYIGVAPQTGTMIGTSGIWERIALTIVPNNNGMVNARVSCNADLTGMGIGTTYFDSFDVN